MQSPSNIGATRPFYEYGNTSRSWMSQTQSQQWSGVGNARIWSMDCSTDLESCWAPRPFGSGRLFWFLTSHPQRQVYEVKNQTRVGRGMRREKVKKEGRDTEEEKKGKRKKGGRKEKEKGGRTERWQAGQRGRRKQGREARAGIRSAGTGIKQAAERQQARGQACRSRTS
jgi:hypothetical protein